MKKERTGYQVHYGRDENGNCGCYSGEYNTIEEAKMVQRESRERNEGDGYDAYWRNMPSVIEKVTEIIEDVEEVKENNKYMNEETENEDGTVG